MRTMKAWNIIPRRIRRRVFKEMENRIRTAYPSIYKVLLFGRTNINTPQYWDETWRTDTENREYTELFELILSKVPEGSNVLDVGCGIGKLAKLIRDRRSAKVTCLDFSPWACQQLAAQGFDTIVSELPMIPLPDNSFDVVIATEVMEHLNRPDATLRQMRRVVRTGGLIMFSVPNTLVGFALPRLSVSYKLICTIYR